MGKTYQEAYDVEAATPKPAFLKVYEKVKRELRDMGIPTKLRYSVD